MKKILVVLSLLTVVIMVASCASSGGGKGRKTAGGFPQFVLDAIKEADTTEGLMFAVGSAKMGNMSQSMTYSTARARRELSRTLVTVVDDMILDHFAGSENDSSMDTGFQEDVGLLLSRSVLRGSRITTQNSDATGRVWTVVHLSKNDAVAEANDAASQAKKKRKDARTEAFNALNYADKAWNGMTNKPIPHNDKD